MQETPSQETGQAAQRVEGLLAEIEKERRERRRNQKIISGIFGGATVLLLLLVVANWWRGKGFDFGDLSSLGGLVGLVGVAAAASTAQKKATKSLAEFDDLRGVGALAEALEFDDKETKTVAAEALTRLLPRLQVTDALLLDAANRKNLNAVLQKARHGDNLNLARAILKAYEQIGGASELEPVKALAAQTEFKKPEAREASEAAQECLPFLERRVEQERAQKSLLRASSAGEAFGPASQTLVRPAEGVTPTAALELLRAAAPEGAPVPLDADFLRGVLRDLEARGDARALADVERIARSPDLPTDLRLAAERCLKRLRERQEEVLGVGF